MSTEVATTAITNEIIRELLPRNSNQALVESMTETLNKLIGDEEVEFRDTLRDNILGYADVVKTGRYKVEDYLNAVKFVTWRLAGNTFEKSYMRTFPERYNRLVAEGKTKKEMSSYVSAYSKNKLVVTLSEQALMPSYLLNADIFQRALNAQAKIMRTAQSDMVRMSAADSLMKHLKQPENTKISLDIAVTSNDAMDELRQVTQELRNAQRQAIINNDRSVIDVAHTKILSDQKAIAEG